MAVPFVRRPILTGFLRRGRRRINKKVSATFNAKQRLLAAQKKSRKTIKKYGVVRAELEKCFPKRVILSEEWTRVNKSGLSEEETKKLVEAITKRNEAYKKKELEKSEYENQDRQHIRTKNKLAKAVKGRKKFVGRYLAARITEPRALERIRRIRALRKKNKN